MRTFNRRILTDGRGPRQHLRRFDAADLCAATAHAASTLGQSARANPRAKSSRTRFALLPLDEKTKRTFSLARAVLHPLLWAGVLFFCWMGEVGFAGLFLAAALVFVWGLSFLPRPQWTLFSARPPHSSRLFLLPLGLSLLCLRRIVRSLDLYLALLLSVSGTLYRIFGHRIEGHTIDPMMAPVVSVLIAVALSTLVQQWLALNSPSAVSRFALLPVSPLRVLFACDLALLAVCAVLTAPLSLCCGLTTLLLGLALGRIPALRSRSPQPAWRFISGDVRYGALQVVVGMVCGIAVARGYGWVLLAAILIYLATLLPTRWTAIHA